MSTVTEDFLTDLYSFRNMKERVINVSPGLVCDHSKTVDFFSRLASCISCLAQNIKFSNLLL